MAEEETRSDCEPSAQMKESHLTSILAAVQSLRLPGGKLARGGVALLSMAVSSETGHAATGSYVATGASRIFSKIGTNPTSTKRYIANCFDDGSGEPNKMRVRIQGQTVTAKFLVKVTVEKDGVQQSAVSSKNGKGLNFSPYASVSGGPGQYTITISKVPKKPGASASSMRGAMVFETRQECDTESGAYTGLSMPVPIP